ncbi:MAG: D-2-hydroxyacid dehydrogenase family protein [Gaiellaceae bacterium]
MKIAILDDYQDAVRGLECFRLLDGQDVTVVRDTREQHDLFDVEAVVLIRDRTRVDAAFLDGAPRLRVISQTGKVGRNVDDDACRARGIEIREGSGSPVAPAELTWALVLAGMCRVTQYAERLHVAAWQQNGLEGTPEVLGRVLAGRTLGVLGLGRIGARVAGYARAFEMEVVVWGRERSLMTARDAGLRAASSQRELFAAADVVSLHVRLTAETAGLVSLDDLRAMPSGSLLVNTSRAELVEPGALIVALAEGRPAVAALDVFDEEPAIGDPLLALPNVVATPHIGFVERDSYELMLEAAFRNLLAES